MSLETRDLNVLLLFIFRVSFGDEMKEKKERTSERENGGGVARGRDHFEIHLKEKKKKKTERESRTRREESTRMSSRNSFKKEKKRTRKR